MRTERAIDHSESAGASSCGPPRAITTPVASREIGLLAGARSVGYPHSAGGKASARRSKKQRTSTSDRSGLDPDLPKPILCARGHH